MNDYDFGKYYRRNSTSAAVLKAGNAANHKLYRKISIGLAAGLILFFAGLMTGLQLQHNRVITATGQTDLSKNENTGIVNSADINTNEIIKHSATTHSEIANQSLKKSLMDPENEYIILAKKYNESSRDRALYYADVLNKITKDYNYKVFPSIRGKNIKLYIGPMKGKKMAEKVLVRVKSIPEFTNSAILYKK